MVAYRSDAPVAARHAKLSHDLLHGLPPEEFQRQSSSLDDLAESARQRLRAELTERLKTPVDAPSWGPEWVGARTDAKPRQARDGEAPRDEDIIVRNLERSRQVHHFRWLYLGAATLALAIALLAMFVDYQIIRGDVWTRALSNQFMEVPASLQASVIFKSMQVLFAVLIVHFMLKITGAYGRNAMITAAFVLAVVMIGSLGYLVAYNNLAGATSASYQNMQADNNQSDAQVDSLLNSVAAHPVRDRTVGTAQEASLPLPKLSKTSLANADSWIWFAFASVIFFIVTTVAALYMLMFEANLRNLVLAGDYPKRRRHLTQLHMLDRAAA